MNTREINTIPATEYPTKYPHITYTSTRNGVKFYSERIFSLSAPIQQYFEQYFLLYWKSDWFIQQSKNKEGILPIYHGGAAMPTNYAIRYHTRNTNRGILLAHPEVQVALSFRKPSIEWNLPAIVLVSIRKDYSNE